MTNKGYDLKEIESLQSKLKASGKNYLPIDVENNSDEYVHFQFLGKHNNKPVIFDAVIYTLRLHHSSEVFEIAEHRAAKHFPDFKKIAYREDENGNMAALDSLEEEIGLYMAEVIAELEEEEEVKVKEHVELDEHIDFGVGLDIGLNVEKITPEVIESFIVQFNEDKLELDPTLYSFQNELEEE
ncbi:MAG TPA: hypothetical protein PKC24_06720 [Cyclobacteriaceae bacterium]|nr:hypothetical protein [Cyclobacteriaceae bacterium]